MHYLIADGVLQLPGTHNGHAALQARAAGFEACYLSGAAMTASMGLPDLGIITVDEVTFFIRQVARASMLPVLVDGDQTISPRREVGILSPASPPRRCRTPSKLLAAIA